jgi:hypothetical protein
LTFDQSWEQSGLFDIEQDYPRDLIGYGRNRPRPVWPREVRVAVQFVINPGLRDSASARMTTAVGLKDSVGLPAATPSSAAMTGSATK